MYSHNGATKRSLQGVALMPLHHDEEDALNPGFHIDDDENPEIQDLDDDLDPLGEQVWAVVKSLLSEGEMDRVTIQDVADEVSAGESAVRIRLNRLASMGRIECWVGSGRRPSYYFIPKNDSKPIRQDSSTNTSQDGVEAMLAQLTEMTRNATEKVDLLKKEIELKQEKLDSLNKDIEAYHRVITNLQEQSAKKLQEGN